MLKLTIVIFATSLDVHELAYTLGHSVVRIALFRTNVNLSFTDISSLSRYLGKRDREDSQNIDSRPARPESRDFLCYLVKEIVATDRLSLQRTFRIPSVQPPVPDNLI